MQVYERIVVNLYRFERKEEIVSLLEFLREVLKMRDNVRFVIIC
jgi:hypothetical protein